MVDFLVCVVFMRIKVVLNGLSEAKVAVLELGWLPSKLVQWFCIPECPLSNSKLFSFPVLGNVFLFFQIE